MYPFPLEKIHERDKGSIEKGEALGGSVRRNFCLKLQESVWFRELLLDDQS